MPPEVIIELRVNRLPSRWKLPQGWVVVSEALVLATAEKRERAPPSKMPVLRENVLLRMKIEDAWNEATSMTTGPLVPPHNSTVLLTSSTWLRTLPIIIVPSMRKPIVLL